MLCVQKMFAITRYNVESSKTTAQDKNEILKRLREDAVKRSNKRKRKLVDDTDEPNVPQKCSSNEESDAESDAVKVGHDEQKIQPYFDKDEVDDNDSETDDAEKHKDMDQSTETYYDPFEIFKKRMKSSNKRLTEDMITAVRDGLPEWVKYPKFIRNDFASKEEISDDTDFMSSIDSIIKENLQRIGIKQLFPVQTDVMPMILKDFVCEGTYRPNDICVCSPTGSGKTLAFAIPIVQYMLALKPHDTRAIVVIPTIELAKQVHDVFVNLAKGCNIQCALLGNGQVENDIQLFRKKTKYGFDRTPEIVVSTPGRFAHLLEIPELLSLEGLRFLVIDEADRVLQLVKQSWLSKLKAKVPHWSSNGRVSLQELCKPGNNVQKLLFSATLNPDPEKLKELDLFQPRLFVPEPDLLKKLKNRFSKVSQYVIPPTLTQHSIQCKANTKPLVVVSLLSQLKVKKALCFTSSAESARRLHIIIKYYHEKNLLESPCLEFSSLLTKKIRKRNMNDFMTKPSCILVSSDAAARGIDATDIEIVIIYDMPQYIEGYIHRAGRASRAGKKGSVYSLVTDDDDKAFKRLFRKAKLQIPEYYEIDQNAISGLSNNYADSLSYCQKISAGR